MNYNNDWNHNTGCISIKDIWVWEAIITAITPEWYFKILFILCL